jgi:hypothetical protein
MDALRIITLFETKKYCFGKTKQLVRNVAGQCREFLPSQAKELACEAAD